MTKKGLNLATFGLGLTLILALIAELFRLRGLLLIDLWVPVFVGAYIILGLLDKSLKARPRTLIPAAVFVIIGFASLLINTAELSTGSFISSTIYGARWAAYFLLSLVAANEIHQRDIILKMLIAFGVLLSIAGFIQLQIAPDFTAYENLGWDPHVGRLLSTWFDPNFVGGLLAFLLAIVAALSIDKKKWRIWLIPSGLIMLIALFFTLSRSAYLAFLTGVIVVGLLRSWKILAIMTVLVVLLIASSTRVQDRVIDLVGSVQSVFTETYTIPDPSARLRFGSWEEGWLLFQQKPILGHGYNAYPFAAVELGTLKDTEIHSATGSDSSLLTILATTGIVGFIPFMAVYILLAAHAWRTRKDGFSVGFLGGLAGLFIHSIFVNSLLFPLFMAPFWLAAGLLIETSPKADEHKT